MKGRRKKIITAVVACAAVLVAYFIVRFTVLNRAEEHDSNIRRLGGELSELKKFNRRGDKYRAKFKDYAARTLGLVPQEVSEQIRVRIDRMVSASGMRRDKTASMPINGTPTSAYQEIGWKYSLIGTLRQVVSMMFLLKNDPYLHQVKGFSISPTKGGKEFKLAFQYVTLVLHKDRKNGKEKIITGDVDNPKPIVSLTKSKTLSLYGGIAERNLFRPFIRKQPPRATTVPTPPKADWKRFKIVSLSQWGKNQDICVEDNQTGRNKQYSLGDSLAGGKIVMVDYRKLPRLAQPELLSYSRVILKVGRDYYAVELGETLAEKYRLTGKKIPPALRGKP